jgi:hypothetical protein
VESKNAVHDIVIKLQGVDGARRDEGSGQGDHDDGNGCADQSVLI